MQKDRDKMKKAIIIILTLVSVLSFGQNEAKLKGKPETLEETFQYLDQMIGDTLKYNFMILPEDVATSRLHFPFGMWIRNEWGLWKNSDLKRYFLEKGIEHPDDMSGIIFTSYHRFLNEKPIDIEGQIEKINRIYNTMEIDTLDNGQVRVSYLELLIGQTTNEELLEYYPKGDTVLVTLSGKKGLFKKYVTFTALAQIKGYEENKLILELLKLNKSEKIKSDYQVGDEINARMTSCSLIPPKNWKK